VDKGGLWFRVLAARYGMKRGRLSEGGREDGVCVVEGDRAYSGQCRRA
jgi:hypothetical protein